MFLPTTLSLAALATTALGAVTPRVAPAHNPPYCDSDVVTSVWLPLCPYTQRVYMSEYSVSCTKRGCSTKAYVNAPDKYAAEKPGFNVICSNDHSKAGSWQRCDNDADDSRVYMKVIGSPQLPYSTIWISNVIKATFDSGSEYYTNITTRTYENVWEDQAAPMTLWFQTGECYDPSGKAPYCTSGPIAFPS